MKFESISEAFEWMRDGYGYSEALADCINANNLGQTALLQHFDQWLWLPENQTEDEVYKTDEDKQYARELGRIEEFLINERLIHTDE
jgi:hypothetical protein